MTEGLMIKLVAGALFVGIPVLVAAVVERLLRGVSIEALRRAFWGLMALAGALVLVLVALNPARSGNADMQTVGNILAGAAIASFFAALILGYVARLRRA